MNPYAPQIYNGIPPTTPANYIDVDFTYVYDVVLTANQFLRDQQQPLMPDADFIWRAWLTTTASGVFSIRFSDSQGYYLSNAMILNNQFTNGVVAAPTPIFPEIVFPAGSRIGIDIQDLSNAGNTIEIGFKGVKRYRVA